MTSSYSVIGESCFLFTVGKYKIITDPWFGESIYGGAWTQFPLPRISLEQLQGLTHVFISHVHPDHCCIHSIKKILQYSPAAKPIIMDRGDSPCYISKKLSRLLGKGLIEGCIRLKPYVKYDLGDLSIWCLPPSTENSLNDTIDSSLLLHCPEGLVLFSNDNLPTHEHATFINSLDIHQFIALIPFSGGSGYPSTYMNIDFEDKLKIANNIREDYEKVAIDFLANTSFDYFMPIAGNHILTSRSHDFHATTAFLQNPYSAILKVVRSKASSIGIYIQPGCDLCSSTTGFSEDELLTLKEDYDFNKSHFIESVSSRMVSDLYRHEEVSDELITQAFMRYAEFLRPAIEEISLLFPDELPLLVLTCSGLSLCIDRSSTVINSINTSAFEHIVDSHRNHPFMLCIEFSPPLLNAIVNKVVHINEADAACLLTYYRSMPYNPELYSAIFSTII